MNLRKEKSFLTRQSQMEILVSYMEEHPELVDGKMTNGMTVDKKYFLWTELQKILNAAVPGCDKTVQQWRRTWVDRKSGARTKAKAIERQIKKGKLPPKISNLEERIIKLIDNRILLQEQLKDKLEIKQEPLDFDLEEMQEANSSFEHSAFSDISSSAANVGNREYDLMLLNAQKILLRELAKSERDCSFLKSNADPILTPEKQPNEISVEPMSVKVIPVLVSDSPISTTAEMCSNTVASASLKPTQNSKENTAESELTVITIKEEPPEVLPESNPENLKDPSLPVIVSVAPVSSTTETSDTIDISKEPECSTLTPGTAENSTKNPTPSFSKYNFPSMSRRERRVHNKEKGRSMAVKAAYAFTNIAEKNSVILERLATAMEIQATQALKQTKLLENLVDILSKKASFFSCSDCSCSLFRESNMNADLPTTTESP